MHYVEHNLNDNKHQDAPPTMLMENLKTKLETKTTLAQGSTKMNLSRPRKNLSNHHEKYEALKLCRPHQSSMSLIGWLIDNDQENTHGEGISLYESSNYGFQI